MKILFVLENYYPKIGGVETLFKFLVDELVAQGHGVTVITNGPVNIPYSKNKSPRLNVIRLPFFNRYVFTVLGILPVFFYSFGKDIIHTTSYNAAVPAFLGGKLSGKKVIITFHEVWGKLWFDLPFMSKFSKYLHYLFEQFILKFSFDKFIAVSKYTASSLIKNGVDASKVTSIYNGVNYKSIAEIERNFKIITSDEPTSLYKLSFFGRLGISKGLDILIDAIELLKSDDRLCFNIVIPKTPRSLFNRFNKLILEKGVSERIKIYHHLEKEVLFNLIKRSDAIVIPSYSEGFCFAAVETMALGTPIIHSGRGALSEVVTGKHIVMKDQSAESLAEAIISALNEEWMDLPLRKYELHEKVDQYLQLYQQIVK